MLTEIAKKLRLDFIDAKEQDETGYLVRFVSKNYELDEEEFVEKFEKDQEERAEAQTKAEHVRLNALDTVLQSPNLSDEQRDVLVQLKGNGAIGETGNADNEVN